VIFRLKAETEVWTGNASRRNESLQISGLLGCIRWWAEVLTRGAGGYACDPVSQRCRRTAPCLICWLFGGVGEGHEKNAPLPRAARFFVRAWQDEEGEAGHKPPLSTLQTQALIKDMLKDTLLALEFRFWGKAAEPWEVYTLDKAIRLICSYGLGGGRTPYRPSAYTEKPSCGHLTLRECGSISGGQWVARSDSDRSRDRSAWEQKVKAASGKASPHYAPELKSFWSLDGWSLYNCRTEPFQLPSFQWLKSHLAGRRGAGADKPISAKVFSCTDPRRTWGYLPDSVSRDHLKTWLTEADADTTQITWGETMLKEI